MTKKSMKRVISFYAFVLSVVLIALLYFVHIKYEVPRLLLWCAFIPLYWFLIYLFSKFTYRGKRKKVIDELEHEAIAEAEAENGKGERPEMSSLVLMSLACIVMTLFGIAEIVTNMCGQVTIDSAYVKGIVPSCVNLLTLLVCTVCIIVMMYNIRRRRVFVSSNANMMYIIGGTVVFSTLLQMEIWDTTEMVPNSSVSMYYLLFGILVVFFGRLFDISIRIKKEQDLTI